MQQPFDKQPNKQIFEKWMAGTGPAHLFVYHQKPYRMNEQGEIEELRQPAEFVVTDGKFEFSFACVGHRVVGFMSFVII